MSDKKSKTFIEYSNFLDKLFAKEELAKLTEISPLGSFNEEIQDILKTFYNHEDGDVQRLGSVMNAIFTQQNGTFTLSTRLANDLVRNDTKRHGFKSCEQKSYNRIIHKCLIGGIFEKIRDPVGKKAALYKLIDPKSLEALQKSAGVDLLKAKETKFIVWWDSTTPQGEVKVERVLTEEEKKAREIADGIFKRKKT